MLIINQRNLPVNPGGHRQANVLTGIMARKKYISDAIKSEALPNLRTDRHCSKLMHGSRTQRLSSKGKTYKHKNVWNKINKLKKYWLI